MALTRVQAAPKASGTNLVMTFTTPPAVGSAVVVAAVCWGGALPSTCTDNRGHTYTLVTTASNSNPRLGIWFCERVTTTGTPFTVTATTSGGYGTAIEVGGLPVGGTIAVDQFVTATGSSATPSSGLTPALTNADAFGVLVLSMNASLSSLVVDAVTPVWTQDLEDLTFGLATGEVDSRALTGGAGVQQSGGWTANASANWVAALAVFGAVAAPPPAGVEHAFAFIGVPV